MAELNKVLFIGRLTRDPELRQTGSGTDVVNARLAGNRSYRVGDEKREETTYINIVVMGGSAKAFSQYVAKGREVLVVGNLRNADWEDKEGNQRKDFEIRVQEWSFVGPPPGEGKGGGEPAPKPPAEDPDRDRSPRRPHCD